MAEVKFDVFVIADLCVDLLFSGTVRPQYGQTEQFIDDYTMEIGGSAAIFAAQFAKLGGRVGLAGIVGKDFFSELLLQKIQSLGISTEFIATHAAYKTAVGLGLFDGRDRAMLTYQGSLQALRPAMVRPGWAALTRHWHIASYFLLTELQPFWPHFLPQLRARGVTISLDTNWAPTGDWAAVHQLLPLIDVFLPNENEAKLIAGKATLTEAGHWLSKYCPLVIVKCGADGAMVFQDQQLQTFSIPTTLTQGLKIADTTGAGDNFDAGFLRAWLLDKSLPECVYLGMRCGTLSLRALGGIAGQIVENTTLTNTTS